MPVGWKRYAASASGRPYFFNPNTGGTQWSRPSSATPSTLARFGYDPATQRTSWVEPGRHAWQEMRTQRSGAADDDAAGAAAAAAAVAAAALHDDAAARMAAREARARAAAEAAAPPASSVDGRAPSACRSPRLRRRRRRRAARRARRRARGRARGLRAAEHLRAAAAMSPRRRSLEGASGDGPAAASSAARPDGPLMIRDLDTGRWFRLSTPTCQGSDVAPTPTCCCPFPDASQAGASQVSAQSARRAPPLPLVPTRAGDAAAPLALVVSAAPIERRRRERLFVSAASDGGQTHYDVRWRDGALKFTGKLEVLPQPARGAAKLVELAMYDDYINYYGFPRELGFIRRKQLQAAGGDCLLEVIIPRVSSGGSAAQFRVNAVPGQSMLSMYKAKRAREHMFVLRGRLTFLDNRALVELRHREADGELTVVFQARRVRAKDGGANNAWRVGFCHPLSAFQTFCILLALVAEKLDGE